MSYNQSYDEISHTLRGLFGKCEIIFEMILKIQKSQLGSDCVQTSVFSLVSLWQHIIIDACLGCYITVNPVFVAE